MKRKTLQFKYLFVNTSIVFISFLILGIMLWITISDHWQREKRELFTNNAKSITRFIEQNSYEHNGTLYLRDNKFMKDSITTLASGSNADVFITNLEGETIFSSDFNADIHKYTIVPKDIINEAINGENIGTTTLNGIYKTPYYIIGIPITVKSEIGINTIGIVFTATDIRVLQEFRADIFQIFIYAMISAFILSFCAISFLTYKMSKPLYEMSIAAKAFGKGDFSKRVEVKSNDEIGELSLAFNNMADSLATSENVRRNFIANVSHELKTPMTTISGFVDGILDGTISKNKSNDYLKIVSSETKRLSRLVKSMLDLSRIDSGSMKLNKKSFDVTKVIIDTLISFEKKIEEKSLDIKGMESVKNVFINGDIDMIHQVVYNLIENAVKFTPKKGFIEISIKEDLKKVFVSIKNSSEGISPEELSMIFHRFYKIDKSRSEDKNGMGLGLYIVKTIIKLHGGEIKVFSKQGEYCEFRFYLPK